jgi:hypothetical protein
MTVPLTSCLTGSDKPVLPLKQKLSVVIQLFPNQTGGQRYSDTSPFSIPCSGIKYGGLVFKVLRSVVMVITAAFHSVGTKRRGLVSPIENACSDAQWFKVIETPM